MPGRTLTFGRSSLEEPTSTLISSQKGRSSFEGRPSFSMESFTHGKHKISTSRGSGSGKSTGKNSPKLPPVKAAHFDMVIESPPLVFLGSPAHSSGALLSGRLRLIVTESEVNVHSSVMKLLAVSTTKRPVAPHCPECSTKSTELFEWNFLSEPKTFDQGEHSTPFSYLLPGHLPATTHSWLGDIEYILSVKATTALGESLTFGRPIKVQRAIFPGPEKSCIRIFPPTKLTAHVTIPPVIHPIGDFLVEFRLSGVVKKEAQSQTRWRLKRMMWRVDENAKIISPACPRHATKVGGEGKGIQHKDTRSVGSDELKSGWKTDYDSTDGCIEMEFKASMNAALKPICDVESPAGMAITHQFVLELVVAEEWCPNNNLHSITPTGAARILRMQFNTAVTERSGLGISWDEEQPPMYEDVPASPPTYAQMIDFEEGSLDHEDLERLSLGRSSPSLSPTQRHRRSSPPHPWHLPPHH
ncbi:MAG: hypothetical protein M1812_004109 [Candelaria pacifica]|nr:MAG: hypothetical protein M1812_004109 [Candelaria pacifica]